MGFERFEQFEQFERFESSLKVVECFYRVFKITAFQHNWCSVFVMMNGSVWVGHGSCHDLRYLWIPAPSRTTAHRDSNVQGGHGDCVGRIVRWRRLYRGRRRCRGCVWGFRGKGVRIGRRHRLG